MGDSVSSGEAEEERVWAILGKLTHSPAQRQIRGCQVGLGGLQEPKIPEDRRGQEGFLEEVGF